MGFAEQLQEIIGRLPGGHQTVLFSATLPKLLVEFARAGEGATGASLGFRMFQNLSVRKQFLVCYLHLYFYTSSLKMVKQSLAMGIRGRGWVEAGRNFAGPW